MSSRFSVPIERSTGTALAASLAFGITATAYAVVAGTDYQLGAMAVLAVPAVVGAAAVGWRYSGVVLASASSPWKPMARAAAVFVGVAFLSTLLLALIWTMLVEPAGIAWAYLIVPYLAVTLVALYPVAFVTSIIWAVMLRALSKRALEPQSPGH